MPKKKPPNRDTVLLPKQRMVEADAAEKRLLNNITKTLFAVYKGAQEVAKKKYDSVVGTLPEWVPPDYHLQFENARHQLLKQLSHAEILSYLKEYDKYLKPNYDGQPAFPIGYTKHIGTLHYIQRAISMGEEKGLAWLVGSIAARKIEKGERYRIHQSSIAKRPRVKVGDERESINHIIRKLALLKEHEDESAKGLWPHFVSALDERDLEPNESNDRIEYDCNDRRRSITFGRFANVVSLYRKNKSR